MTLHPRESNEPRRLRLDGIVAELGGGLTETSPLIGESNVITEIDEIWGFGARSHVRVWLGVDPEEPQPEATGDLSAYHGFGGTDVTPADSPEILIGGFNLVWRLMDFDGRHVTLIIEDVDERDGRA